MSLRCGHLQWVTVLQSNLPISCFSKIWYLLSRVSLRKLKDSESNGSSILYISFPFPLIATWMVSGCLGYHLNKLDDCGIDWSIPFETEYEEVLMEFTLRLKRGMLTKPETTTKTSC